MILRSSIIFCILFCSCSSVTIHPKIYPTFNWQKFLDDERRCGSTLFTPQRMQSNWEHFKQSVGIQFELCLKW